MWAFLSGFLLLLTVSFLLPFGWMYPQSVLAVDSSGYTFIGRVAPEGDPVLAPWNFPQASLVEVDQELLVTYSGRTVTRESPLFVRSLDRSTGSWSTPERISPESMGVNMGPSLWVDPSGNVHCAWLSRRGRSRPYEVFYSRREAGKREWTEPVRLASGTLSHPPHLSGDSEGTLYVVHANRPTRRSWGRVFVHVSEDGGKSWRDSDPNFPPGVKKGHSHEPVLHVGDGGEILLVWVDTTPGSREIVLNGSRDRGRTWLPALVTPAPDPDRNTATCHLQKVGGKWVLAWTVQTRDERGFRTEVWVASSRAGTAAWTSPRRLYEERVTEVTVRVYDHRGTLGVVWREKDRDNAGALKGLKFSIESLEPESSEPVTLKELPRGVAFSRLEVLSSGDGPVVAAAHSGWGRPGEVTIFRSREGASDMWDEFSVAAEGPLFDVVGPMLFRAMEGGIYLLAHQVRRRQFPMEPLSWESDLRLFELRR